MNQKRTVNIRSSFFDASFVLGRNGPTEELFDYVIKVDNGEQTKNEENGYEAISIFKDGVTL